MKTPIDSFTKINGKNISVFLTKEQQEHWWAGHKLSVIKNNILGIRGSAIGNTDNHPEYYLTLKCLKCNKYLGTLDESTQQKE